jgi:excisionase family DNA binding protein
MTEPARVPTDPDWLTIREVARRLSVTPKQIRKWIESGQFDEVVVFSKRVTRISLEAYQRFVQKMRAA